MEPYLAVTAHYIDSPPAQPTQWELKHNVLGYASFQGRHTGSNTAAVVTRVIDRYHLAKKVSTRLVIYSCANYALGWLDYL